MCDEENEPDIPGEQRPKRKRVDSESDSDNESNNKRKKKKVQKTYQTEDCSEDSGFNEKPEHKKKSGKNTKEREKISNVSKPGQFVLLRKPENAENEPRTTATKKGKDKRKSHELPKREIKMSKKVAAEYLVCIWFLSILQGIITCMLPFYRSGQSLACLSQLFML